MGAVESRAFASRPQGSFQEVQAVVPLLDMANHQ